MCCVTCTGCPAAAACCVSFCLAKFGTASLNLAFLGARIDGYPTALGPHFPSLSVRCALLCSTETVGFLSVHPKEKGRKNRARSDACALLPFSVPCTTCRSATFGDTRAACLRETRRTSRNATPPGRPDGSVEFRVDHSKVCATAVAGRY